jgi:hypothetical protein
MPLFLKKEESSPLLSPSFIPYDIQQPASRMYSKGHCYNNLSIKTWVNYQVFRYNISFILGTLVSILWPSMGI